MSELVARASRRGKTKLANGRSLGWAEWGDEHGRPVLFLSGAGTSASLGFGVDVLDRLELRLIGVDRPGLGLSDPAPDRRLRDWADDIAAFIDTRALGPTPVVGFAQGGPFALACAAAGVVRAAAIVSSPEEPTKPPSAVVEAGLDTFDPARIWTMITNHAVPVDRAVYLRPSFAAVYRRALDEGFSHGSDGYIRDTLLAMRPWGLPLADIQVPLDLWYGALDLGGPEAGTSLAAQIPHARRTVVPNAGATLLWTHALPILTGLLNR